MKEKLFTGEINVDYLHHDRQVNTRFTQGAMHLLNRPLPLHIPFLLPKDKKKTLARAIDPTPFVPAVDEAREERCEEIFHIQINGLAKRLVHTQAKKAVIGVSGGLDSTLALLVAVMTFDTLGLPRKQIIGVTMPGFGTSKRTYRNANLLIRALGVTFREISIKKACRQHFKDIGHDEQIQDVTYENTQARERTQILMDLANQENGLVIGTGDLSELALGWATYNGDHMSMYAVNAGIPKTLVRYLVEWVACHKMDKQSEHILLDIADTPISPELIPAGEDNTIRQKTEELVGPYELHDFFLYHFVRFGASPEKIYFLAQQAFKGKYARGMIKKWLRVFISRFFAQQFKRSCLPDGPKVGSISLSPRSDWRMPSDASVSLWLKELDALD
jgi:NAD+ synthase (glutamine-hydrolysing)